jgi:hypothetical protein
MMKAMGLAATAADGVFATRLAGQGFTGPSGTLEWFASKMKPAKPDLTVDLEVAHYRLPRVAFKRFPIQIDGFGAVTFEGGPGDQRDDHGQECQAGVDRAETHAAVMQLANIFEIVEPVGRGTLCEPPWWSRQPE